MKAPPRILFVCLGNICRSPMAEGILRHKFSLKGMDIEVDSAGTSDLHTGENPDPRAVQVAKENGIDISGLRARQLKPADFDRFDFIYVMDESNQREARRIGGGSALRVFPEILLNLRWPGQSRPVPDPWYGSERDFKEVFALLNDVCEEMVAKIKLEWH